MLMLLFIKCKNIIYFGKNFKNNQVFSFEFLHFYKVFHKNYDFKESRVRNFNDFFAMSILLSFKNRQTYDFPTLLFVLIDHYRLKISLLNFNIKYFLQINNSFCDRLLY